MSPDALASARQPVTLKTLLTLAWPVIFRRARQTVVSLSDTLMVAPLGAAALAATATGAEAKDEVPGVVWLTARTAGTWQVLVGHAYFTLPSLLMRPFAQGEHAARMTEVGVRMLMVSAAWPVFDATSLTLAESLRAAGDRPYPLLARLVIAWAVFVPGSWFTVTRFGGGDVGALEWLVVYRAVLAGVLWLRFSSGAWRKVRLLEPSPAL